ncbi:MAG: RibD family protein [Akkermansiaceae bacterium]
MSLRIIANFALTADGKISTTGKAPARFTSKRDLQRLHEIRQTVDAIIVGRGTLEEDQMSMTTTKSPPPWRCVISETGNFDTSHKLFHSEGGPIHLIVTGGKKPKINNATVHQSSLTDWLTWLDQRTEIETLLCEGGGVLMRELLELDLIDELFLTLATHTLFGGRNAPTLTGIPSDFLPESRHFELNTLTKGGADEYFLHYTRRKDFSD